MRSFNTAGPVVQQDHYCIPPLERLDLGQLCELVQGKRYFVLHAPRQTGKTSALLAFRDHLNSGAAGEYRCVYVDVEGAQAAREDVASVIRTVLGCLACEARDTLGDTFLLENRAEILDQFGSYDALQEALSQWARADSRPLVVLIDEIDALVGNGLVSVLRQLRAGYTKRPDRFPQSVFLCGVRDVRDYRQHAPDGMEPVSGGSVFNIKTESLRLGDFSQKEVSALLAQHTEETGQEYALEAEEAVWEYTQGQPWLVNALAAEMCKRRKVDSALEGVITVHEAREAKEVLILRRDTHLDQLMDKLQEDRVRRIIEPMLISAEDHWGSHRDEEYVQDLDLIAQKGPPRIANPIYKEVIPRELTHVLQEGLVARDSVDCVNSDGSLNMCKLLEGFQAFFRKNAEHWPGRFDYDESGAQLILQGYAQGKVNGLGRVEREYGLGRRRVDLMIFWREGEEESRIVIECKMLRNNMEQTLREGLPQYCVLHGHWCSRRGASGDFRPLRGAGLGGGTLPPAGEVRGQDD